MIPFLFDENDVAYGGITYPQILHKHDSMTEEEHISIRCALPQGNCYFEAGLFCWICLRD
jgi:hypothetical protein